MSETFDLIFNLSVSFFQGAIFVFFCNFFFTPKYKKIINLCICWSVITLLFIVISLLNTYFTAYSGLEIIINLAIMIPFSIICHKGKLYLKVIMPIISFLILMCVGSLFNVIITVVFSKNIEQVMIESTIYRYMYILIGNLIYILSLYIIYRLYKNKISLKKPIDIVTFVFIPALTMIVTFFAASVISDTNTSDTNRLYIGIIIIITFIIAFSMFSIMKRIGKSAEIDALNIIMQKEQETYKSEIIHQSQYIEDVSKIKHEMQNKLFCINELISCNKIAEAKKLCKDTETEFSEVPAIFRTNNLYLNALLNMTQKRALDKEIHFTPTIKSNLAIIDGTDLISLLGNLMDNAFEALENVTDNKFLQITIFEKDNYYMFTIRNSIPKSVMLYNPSLETTKKDKKSHGHGLKIVKEIVKKYNGTISYSEKDNMFEVMCMLEKITQ